MPRNNLVNSVCLSLSARRAWIEITYVILLPRIQVSLSARRAWIEIYTGTYHPHFHVSLSARRAWIEILWERATAATWARRSPQGERG